MSTDPSPKAFKAHSGYQTVGQYDDVRTSVEDLGYAAKALLAGGVPHLKFQNFVFHFYEVGAEFHADCDVVLVIKIVVYESSQHAALAYATIANYYDLKKCIKLCLRAICYGFVPQPLYLREVIVPVVLSLFHLLLYTLHNVIISKLYIYIFEF